MVARLRTFLWRYQVLVTVGYLAILIGGCLVLMAYGPRLSAGANIGFTVAARSIVYQRTFREVERARLELSEGDLASAETRLTRFIRRHDDVQPGQLATHAVTTAHELLAEIYLIQGRAGKATRILEGWAETTPLDYRVWLLKAHAARAAGDRITARESYRQAFMLALNHPRVVEDYLGLLSELNDFEEIMWVEDQFRRAARRGRPIVMVKAGSARSPFQRGILEWAGIEVEHGRYFRSLELYGLSFGRERELMLPADLFDRWPHRRGSLYIQLRFENVYEELRIEALHAITKGGERRDLALTPDRVRYQHRPHSGVEYYAEIRLEVDVDEIETVGITYTALPEMVLSEQAREIVDKARVNLLARSSES